MTKKADEKADNTNAMETKMPVCALKLTLKLVKIVLLVIMAFVFIIFALIARFQFARHGVDFNGEYAKKVSYSPLKKVVPGGGLPPGLKIYRSNNNLDVVQYSGRYFLAFRSAPTHFASTKTMLYVLSSTDLEKWEYETKFNFDSDLREPRFLVFKGRLFLYFFKGGANPLEFAPDYIYATERTGKAAWKKPKKVYKQGYVVWRAKERGGKAYMSVYYGAGLYTNETEPGHLQLLESDDGYNYKLVNGSEVSTEPSEEEGEFEFDDEGNLYATIRLEMKGGKVCRAPKEDITDWDCKFTPYKYDSALMFRHGDDFYVVARRSIDGPYNKNATWLPASLRSKYYLVRYSLTRKRTALYKLEKDSLELKPLFDFPSAGDTAYAGITKLDENRYLLLNYSSFIDGFDWSWLGGQLAGSNIYSTVLKFE